jgi:hypothetical protein
MSRASTRVIGLMAILLSAVALGSCGKDDEPTRVPITANCGGPNGTSNSGVSITFNGSASTTPDPPIVTYAWDFGDGTTGAGAVVTHSYPHKTARVDYTYVVTLIITDQAGHSASCQAECKIMDLY